MVWGFGGLQPKRWVAPQAMAEAFAVQGFLGLGMCDSGVDLRAP